MKIAVALVLWGLCGIAQAASDRTEKIEALMQAQGLVAAFEQQLQLSREACRKQADAMLSQILETLKVTPVFDEKFREAAQAFVEAAQPSWTASDIVASWSEYYAPHFTDAELDQLLAFYQSPLAQKEVAANKDAMVQLSAHFEELSKPIAEAATREFLARVQAIAEECNCAK